MHSYLIRRAIKWLMNTRRCCVVTTERCPWFLGEQPDAIGWEADGRSILVECKTSLSDFYSDRKKPGRNKPQGIGNERWYLTPKSLIDPARHTLPENWGLLEMRGKVIAKVQQAKSVDLCAGGSGRERILLLALLRQEENVFIRGARNNEVQIVTVNDLREWAEKAQH